MNEVILLFEILCRSINHDTKKVENKPRAYKSFTDKEKTFDFTGL